jgi:hypothetical protein
MGRRLCRGLILAAAMTAAGTTVVAQFGHPLKGSWSGDWGPSKQQRTRVLLEMSWDGKAISGTINPGAAGIPLTSATLDPATWGVHLEAEGKQPAGTLTKIIIDGKLENIGAYRRVLSGTWNQNGTKGDFRLVLN